MGSNEDNFDISGPVHLVTSFDWGDKLHRRSLAASLVQGVYTMERERQRGRKRQRGSIQNHAHASPWWDRFHFQLHKELKDDKDSSFCGAIFKLKDEHPFGNQSNYYPPTFVIAFRGTLFKKSTTYIDMKLNIKCVFDKLKESSRFHTSFEAVLKTADMAGEANVWIAGHSLGASIAMQVARNVMEKSGYNLETYLFNPPFIRLPIEKMIKNDMLIDVVHTANSFLKAGIAKVIKVQEDQFTRLSEWTPYVFVNPSDLICRELTEYFERRQKMEGRGFGKSERISMRYWVGSMGVRLLGWKLEPYHLLSNAHVMVNKSPPKGRRQAHGIRQWWQHHSQWETKEYKLK